MGSRTLYDISPTLSPATAVFPGDTPLSRRVLMELEKGQSVTLSTLTATVHLGAHADAPSHYDAFGRTIEAQPLDRYIGRCQVIRAKVARGARIKPEDLGSKIIERRVLLATGTWPDAKVFNTDFAALSVELVHKLAGLGVLTVGIDTPSVDAADSKDLPAHKAIAEADIAILEGLDLSQVPPGSYELIAPPLKLEGFDASPVRALLRSIE